jgi:hypothetical protein
MIARHASESLAIGLLAAACGDDDDAGPNAMNGSEQAGGAGAEPNGTLRLGFPNVTHAPAIIGVQEGIFQAAVGDGVDLELNTFNAGGEAIEALLGDSIDATFIGPNPAINGYQQDDELLRIVAGSDVWWRLARRARRDRRRRRPGQHDVGHAGARQHAERRPACVARRRGLRDRPGRRRRCVDHPQENPAREVEGRCGRGELLEDLDLEGIYDLTILNELLAERGEEQVDGL